MEDIQYPDYGPDVVLDDPAFIHPSALMYGKVRIGKQASLWPHVVIRGESLGIEVGPYTNLQDFVMVHESRFFPTRIGAYCSVTHHATVHACIIGDNCLIGINATVMDGAVVGDNCIIAGHCIVTENAEIPDNSIVVGSPGKVIRTTNSYVSNKFNALMYHRNATHFARGSHRAWDGSPEFEAWVESETNRLEEEFAVMGGAG